MVVDEIEKLTRQISPDNERSINIKLANEIIDKMEAHFEVVKVKLKSSELSTFNFSIAEIQNIVPAKLDREATLMYTAQNFQPIFKGLIRHIRTINSIFRTVHYRNTY